MSKRVTIAAVFAEEEGQDRPTQEAAAAAISALTSSDCLVCGEKASGFHYGVFSCEGCKGFFRRSVTRGHVKVCRWGNKCSMDLYTRRRCPECRLRTCKAAGMRPDCLLSQAQRRSKSMWRQLQETQPAKTSIANQDRPTVPSPNQSTEQPSPRLGRSAPAAQGCAQLHDVSSSDTVPPTTQTIKVEERASPDISVTSLDLRVTSHDPMVTSPNPVTLPDLRMTSGVRRMTSPDIRLTSPDLRMTSPDLRVTSADLRMTSPGLRVTSPDLRVTSPDLRMTSPDLRMTSPDLRMTSPDLRMRSADLGMTSPDLRGTSPDVRVTSPDTVMTSPDIGVTLPDLRVTSDLGVTSPADIGMTSTTSFSDTTKSNQSVKSLATKAGKDMLAFLSLLARDPDLLSQPIKDNITEAPRPADSAGENSPTMPTPCAPTGTSPSTSTGGLVKSSTETSNLAFLTSSLGYRKSPQESGKTITKASCTCAAGSGDGNRAALPGQGPTFVQHLTSQNLAIISELLAYKEKTMEEGRQNMLKIWQNTEAIALRTDATFLNYLAGGKLETQACQTLEEKRICQMRHMNDGVAKVIAFIKTLRGFNDLSIEDQVAVVKGSIFEYFLIKVCLNFRESGLGLQDLQGLISTMYIHESMSTFKKWFEGVWRLNLDQVTMYLMLTVVVLSPDRVSIRDSSGLEQAQAQYIECLQAYCKVAYPTQPLMFPRLMGKLTEVRAVGLVVEKCLTADCKAMVKKQPVLPEIWSED